MIGAMGQLGGGLVRLLQSKYGPTSVISTDIRRSAKDQLPNFRFADVTDRNRLHQLVVEEKVGS
jgi:hypothetical protein